MLSGSALTLMERMLDRAAPLFGRATARPQQEQLGPRAAGARRVLFAREGFTAEVREQAAADDALLLTAADLYGGGHDCVDGA